MTFVQDHSCSHAHERHHETQPGDDKSATKSTKRKTIDDDGDEGEGEDGDEDDERSPDEHIAAVATMVKDGQEIVVEISVDDQTHEGHIKMFKGKEGHEHAKAAYEEKERMLNERDDIDDAEEDRHERTPFAERAPTHHKDHPKQHIAGA